MKCEVCKIELIPSNGYWVCSNCGLCENEPVFGARKNEKIKEYEEKTPFFVSCNQFKQSSMFEKKIRKYQRIAESELVSRWKIDSALRDFKKIKEMKPKIRYITFLWILELKYERKIDYLEKYYPSKKSKQNNGSQIKAKLKLWGVM